MNWQRTDAYHITRTCGRPGCVRGDRCGNATCGQYTLTRAMVGERRVYTAWSTHTRPGTALHYGDRDACMDAVERDADTQTGAAA